MKAKEIIVNRIVVLLIILLVATFTFFIFKDATITGRTSDDESFIEYNGYKFHITKLPTRNLYTLEIYKNTIRYLYHFTNNPYDIENVSMGKGSIQYIAILKPGGGSKPEVYVTFDPWFTGEEILSASTLVSILGQADYGFYKLPVQIATTRPTDDKDFPVISCRDASEDVGVIYITKGQKNRIYMTSNECLIAEGIGLDGLYDVTEKLALTYLGVMDA